MVSGVLQPTHGKSESEWNPDQNGQANHAGKEQQNLPAKVAPSSLLPATPTLTDSTLLFYHAVKQDKPHHAVDVDKEHGEQQSKHNQGSNHRREQQWISGRHPGCGDVVGPAGMRPGKMHTA